MKAYIIRRLLLMVPTLLGISVLLFLLIQLLPGGPVEAYIANILHSFSHGGVSTPEMYEMTQIELEKVKENFGYDKPAYQRYFSWLWKIMQGDLGDSFIYRKPVWSVIKERMPISLFLGFTSFFLSYLICIPLGIRKALRHGSWYDLWTSMLIFSGYVIPGYVLALLLIIFFSGGSFLDIFPIGGLVSDNYDSLSLLGKAFDFIYHMTLPLIAYMASELAFLTLLMKNSLMEQLNKDYIRAAQMRGASFEAVVWKHALRNALIPIATRLSEIVTLLFTSALLIEKVFNIDGMGLLVYNAMLDRDYNIVMGIIMLASFLAMIGRLFSDLLYVAIDPRIRYN